MKQNDQLDSEKGKGSGAKSEKVTYPVVFHWVRRMGSVGQTQWSTAVRISP